MSLNKSISNLSLLLLYLLYCACHNSGPDENNDKNNNTVNAVNYDSIVFLRVVEKHYDNFSIAHRDTVLRIVHSKPFSSVFMLLIEKNDSTIIASIKEIPSKYYNPFVVNSNVLVKYTFIKKIISIKQWDNLLNAVQINILNEKEGNYVPDFDGEYYYIEIKTNNKHVKDIVQHSFSNEEKKLSEYFENIMKD